MSPTPKTVAGHRWNSKGFQTPVGWEAELQGEGVTPPRALMAEASRPGGCDSTADTINPYQMSQQSLLWFFPPQPTDRSRKSLAHMVAGRWELAKGKMSAVIFVTLPKTFQFAS